MKILVIGGTGNLSAPTVRLLAEKGHELVVLNRGKRDEALPAGNVRALRGEVADPALDAVFAGASWDAVLDFIAFGPEDVARNVRRFGGRTGRFYFISSTAVLRKPPTSEVVSEETPRGNPYWKYARLKIEGEEVLEAAVRDTAFPGVVIRPSHTYGRLIPSPWSALGYTLVDRLLRGLPFPLPRGGDFPWTLTHAEDFAAGLAAVVEKAPPPGEILHITGEDAPTWTEILSTLASACGGRFDPVPIRLETIDRIDPDWAASQWGDKAWPTRFDLGRLRRYVPGFKARIPLRQGLDGTIRWLRERPERALVNPESHRRLDLLVQAAQKETNSP